MDFCPADAPGIAEAEAEFGIPSNEFSMFCPMDLTQLQLMNNHFDGVYYTISGNITRCEPTIFTDCFPDSIFTAFIDSAVAAMFAPKNSITLKDHT